MREEADGGHDFATVPCPAVMVGSALALSSKSKTAMIMFPVIIYGLQSLSQTNGAVENSGDSESLA